MAIAAVPCVTIVDAIGLCFSPEWMIDGTLRRTWIEAGLPVSIATGQISFFSLQLPGIILMTALAGGAFCIRARVADLAVAMLFISIPFVDAIGFGISYLRTQVVTALTIGLVLVLYFVLRRFVPVKNDPPTDWRLTYGLLGSFTLVCSILYAECS
ncbi:hypothetical protein Mal15_61710 [Stieleria maiorica]|uniref:Uncharacterized protein n=2 Tax=Stieleria maiorica TaxID=2795974 RepID=A0A5B9MST4_9BACT|nr:hypothetical protein Mal15_61710 [Stieleria maiorica]